MSNTLDFTFSDLIAGRVVAADLDAQTFSLETPGGKVAQGKLTQATFYEFTRNLGEPYKDATGQLPGLLRPGNYVFAYGVYYPEAGGVAFEAKHLVFPGTDGNTFFFEQPDWWAEQAKQIADFYIASQFEGGVIDFHKYRTNLTLYGDKLPSGIQETDTISRTVYGFASAYLLTGEERFYEAANKGTEYLRTYLCKRDRQEAEGIVYWLHALKADGTRFDEVMGSLFGDDYGAMPCYEQIYALAGPVQTYRIDGDPDILEDANRTMALFDTYYLDKGPDGGYYSHVTTDTFDPEAESLGHNQARKNWNSIGDHAPAYLFNLFLATGERRYLTFLETTFDMVARHFPIDDGSPFVQEKFYKDWSPDNTWGWQQDRAVVGHDLKIAWNLMRLHSATTEDRKEGYQALAEDLAHRVLPVGMDPQRGGVYDVMERHAPGGEKFHRLAFHDRKAWWQQEQAILAFLILAGTTGKDEYVKLFRETAAFYNAWFLDTDAGAVYFNVLANGLPYLLGTERDKGSHSMGAYHAIELCYLAATYTNLLVRKNPMDLYFKPILGAFADDVLRVAPDVLPEGSVRITAVTVDGVPWADFDAEALTVRLPPAPALDTETWLTQIRAGGVRKRHLSRNQVKVKVTLAPV